MFSLPHLQMFRFLGCFLFHFLATILRFGCIFSSILLHLRASKFTHSLVSSPCFLHLSVNHVYFKRFWKLPFWACLFEMIPRSTETQTDFSPPISSVSRLTGFPDVPGMSGTSPSFRRPPSHHVVIESSCHCWPCQRKCQNKCQAPCSRIHVKLSKKFKQNVRIMSKNISGYVSQNVSGDMSICQKCQECLKIWNSKIPLFYHLPHEIPQFQGALPVSHLFTRGPCRFENLWDTVQPYEFLAGSLSLSRKKSLITCNWHQLMERVWYTYYIHIIYILYIYNYTIYYIIYI